MQFSISLFSPYLSFYFALFKIWKSTLFVLFVSSSIVFYLFQVLFSLSCLMLFYNSYPFVRFFLSASLIVCASFSVCAFLSLSLFSLFFSLTLFFFYNLIVLITPIFSFRNRFSPHCIFLKQFIIGLSSNDPNSFSPYSCTWTIEAGSLHHKLRSLLQSHFIAIKFNAEFISDCHYFSTEKQISALNAAFGAFRKIPRDIIQLDITQYW